MEKKTEDKPVGYGTVHTEFDGRTAPRPLWLLPAAVCLATGCWLVQEPSLRGTIYRPMAYLIGPIATAAMMLRAFTGQRQPVRVVTAPDGSREEQPADKDTPGH